jgi:hypothetical protein
MVVMNMKEFSFIILLVFVTAVSPMLSNSRIRVPVVAQHAEKEKSVTRKFLDAAFAGALSCSMTHSAVVPLDVVKVSID